MTGSAEEQRKIKPEGPLTELVHGSFEEKIGSSNQPAGWYYVRQGEVEAGPEAPEGSHFLTFANTTPGRNAHGMQAFGVDGREIRAIDVSLWVRGRDLGQGQTPRELPQLYLEFYGSLRAPVGYGVLGPWTGNFDWQQQKIRIQVPSRARLAVIGIGLFGGTGKISFDDVKVSPSPRK